MAKDIRYLSEPHHVREVSLVGAADLDFWRAYLTTQGLRPEEIGGAAQVIVSAASMRFAGVRFTELALCVVVESDGADSRRDEVLLLEGYNTSRLLTFCERCLFGTPYRRAGVSLSTEPASLELAVVGKPAICARMPAARPPSRTEDVVWKVKIHLPRSDQLGDRRSYFHARLIGETRTYPFVVGQDCLQLDAAAGALAARALADSRFLPQEWSVRDNAAHARSKTYTEARGAK